MFYPGDDLRDLWRPRTARRLTIRRAAVLAEHLPPEAAIRRTGPDDRHWSHESQVLVSLLDQIRTLSWGLGGAKGSPPQPNPRPGDEVRDAPRIAQAMRRAEKWAGRNKSIGG